MMNLQDCVCAPHGHCLFTRSSPKFIHYQPLLHSGRPGSPSVGFCTSLKRSIPSISTLIHLFCVASVYHFAQEFTANEDFLHIVIIGYCVLVGAFCPPFLRNQTACTCTDYVDGAIIKCNGPNGPLIVEELKKVQAEVRELALENANILEIGSRAFKNLRIKKLVLNNNRIKSIQKDAFRGLESVLQELYINNNKLSEVPTEAIQGLRALNVLSLSCNRIGNLTDVVFQDTPSLIEVNLGCNKICKNIILDNNCLHRIPSKALDGMQFLIALHVKYNKIEKLGSHDLRNMSSLSMLTLTGNSISHISKNFTHNTPTFATSIWAKTLCPPLSQEQ
uniref:Uncharacterized protein n=1 Tax=Ditylenchus dipsaci TaxID=166011 RepID=A0A915EC45_9BILA